MKKVLFIATVVRKHINVFHIPFLRMFQENGYETYVAAANDTESSDVIIPCCDHYVEIGFKRNPLHPGNVKSFIKLKKLIDDNNFDIIHCHTPVGGLLGRLASINSRRQGAQVFYTAHGFHFYKGAPLKNWLFYYPVEKFCSYFTDVLITINSEDYALAKKKFKAKHTEYVPGVGIDLSRFENIQIDRNAKRREIGVPEDAFLLISVGETNENKNHQIIVKAIAELNNYNIHYVIAGMGDKKNYLEKLAHSLKISNQLHLLGFRDDIPDLNYISDVCCFPSIREGLGLAALEAMACGLPIIVSDNRGTKTYTFNGKNGFVCPYNDKYEFAKAIQQLMYNPTLRSEFSKANIEIVQYFGQKKILEKMKKLYNL